VADVSRPRGAAWVEADGLALCAATPADFDNDAVRQALRDAVERGYEGEPPSLPDGGEHYRVEADGAVVGVIGFRRDVPHEGAMTLDTLAVVRGARGHAFGTRALLAAEQRLAAEGILEGYARVGRGNGHGMYFMLRCGYAPVAAPDGTDDGVTWFRRNPRLEPRVSGDVDARPAGSLSAAPLRSPRSARGR
jgi:GNAT superfamily N-acetyltransferase